MSFWDKYFQSKSERSEELEKLHTAAGDFFSRNFPNSQRVDCPSPESFQKLIAENKLPDELLREHLFGCSECFKDYKSALNEVKSSNPSADKIYKSNFYSKFALGLAAALVIFGGVFWLWKRETNSSQIVLNDTHETNRNLNANSQTNSALDESAKLNSVGKSENPAIDKANANINIESADNSHAPENRLQKNLPNNQSKDSGQILLAKKQTVIDLTDPIWRDAANGKKQKSFDVEAGITQLRIRLPKENPKGSYQIFVVDSFGRKLTPSKTTKAVNQNLFVELNLKEIKTNGTRLCFAPIGEIPDCVLVNIKPPE